MTSSRVMMMAKARRKAAPTAPPTIAATETLAAAGELGASPPAGAPMATLLAIATAETVLIETVTKPPVPVRLRRRVATFSCVAGVAERESDGDEGSGR
jgi:hypothetical protein